MWHVIKDGELIPLALLNAEAKCEELLAGHDTTHGGVEYPFCEEYGCSSIQEILDALRGEVRNGSPESSEDHR